MGKREKEGQALNKGSAFKISYYSGCLEVNSLGKP